MKLIDLFMLILLLGVDTPARQSGRNYYVDQNHPLATDEGTGTRDLPFMTISGATRVAGPGDTVFVMAGIYRERVAPASGGSEGRPVVYISPPGENAVIRGSEIWKPAWKKTNMPGNIWEGSFENHFFVDYNPFTVKARDLRGDRTLGQVIVNGKLYAEASREEELRHTAGSWLALDHGTRLQINFDCEVSDPADCKVEITVRERIFAPHRHGLGYIHVNGFTMGV